QVKAGDRETRDRMPAHVDVACLMTPQVLEKQMKIVIAGTGYVGLSNAVVLAQHHEVVALDIDEAKVGLINERRSPIVDPELEDYLAHNHLRLRATTDPGEAYAGAQVVVIATPTDYDTETNFFDTTSVEKV